MSYWIRTARDRFRPTEHVGGAWDLATQHIGPAMGLLAHAVETRRCETGLVIGRLSYDILGLLPLDEVEVRVEVVRPGRTIELVEAAASHGGRDGLRLRAWLMAPEATGGLAGSAYPRLAAPADMAPWDPSLVWPGGYIASADVRREQVEPGRARYWVRSEEPLIADEPVSPLARFAALFDISNGMTVRVPPAEVGFPNVDLTAHLFRQPSGEWLGFDTTVSFGPSSIGLTASVLHDEGGPIGTSSQILTVRPGRGLE